MGGRLDATNIIKPALSIITNISLEHKIYLGNTIAEITREKGGIIKQKNAFSVLKAIAESQSAPIYQFGNAFRIRRKSNGTFNYFGIDNVWRNIHTGLIGRHQVNNAALILAACEVLNKNNLNLTLKTLKNGLEQNRWPGRLEIVSSSPLILLDGAHNFIAARNLARYLDENLSDRNITLVIGILDDKPYKAMLKNLLPLCKKVILTRPKIDRAIAPENLHPPEDVICIAGSLYVVGEAKEMFEKKPVP